MGESIVARVKETTAKEAFRKERVRVGVVYANTHPTTTTTTSTHESASSHVTNAIDLVTTRCQRISGKETMFRGTLVASHERFDDYLSGSIRYTIVGAAGWSSTTKLQVDRKLPSTGLSFYPARPPSNTVAVSIRRSFTVPNHEAASMVTTLSLATITASCARDVRLSALADHPRDNQEGLETRH